MVDPKHNRRKTDLGSVPARKIALNIAVIILILAAAGAVTVGTGVALVWVVLQLFRCFGGW